jgi:phosphoribosyl-AMP cyclohydrolase
MMSAKQGQVHSWMDEIAWSLDGLVAAVVQDASTGEVLMCAWMNREALVLTVERGEAHYWSRSRQRLWRKGEESGHLQKVKELRLDCDGDVVLLRVEQQGGIACHTGRARCFFRRYQNGSWVVTDPVLKDPDEIYSGRPGAPKERLR